MKIKQLQLYFLTLVLIMSFSGCSDNGGSSEGGGDAPALPDISAQAQPDISFFENNSVESKISSPSLLDLYRNYDGKIVMNRDMAAASPMNAYNSASLTVLSSAFIGGIFPAFSSFMQEASQEEASFNNGVWEWTYSGTSQGVTGSFRLTAETGDNATEWNLYMFYDDGQSSLDNANIISGTIQNNESSGEWEFRFPNESNTVKLLFSSDWEIMSDTQKKITFSVYDGSTSPVTEIIFESDKPEFYMTFNDLENSDSQVDFEVYWNTDTSIGYYYVLGGDPPKQCWDDSLQDIACSDVGL